MGSMVVGALTVARPLRRLRRHLPRFAGEESRPYPSVCSPTASGATS